MFYSDVEKCHTEGFNGQNFIRTDNKFKFLVHILLFGLIRLSKSFQITGMSKKIATSLLGFNTFSCLCKSLKFSYFLCSDILNKMANISMT